MSLKVLHILSSPHLGGAERVCLDLAKSRQTSGFETKILFLSKGLASECAEKEGLVSIIAEDPELASDLRSRRWKAAMRALERTAEDVRPHVVHSHVPLTHLICNRVLPKMSIPWIASMHGSWRQFAYAPHTAGRSYLRPYLFLRHAVGDFAATRSAARIVAVADYVKQDLECLGISGRRITTVHNGLKPVASPIDKAAARARLALPDSALIIGSMGYFAPVKGFDILLRGFARISAQFPEALLVIAGGDVSGDDRTRREMERLIARLGIGERVRLLGVQDPRAGFLAALDILAIASRTEGMPLILLDAMWHGKPVVVSSAGGSQEAARPDKEGLVFRTQDPADLAEKLGRLLKDPILRESLGKAAWARASSYLTISRCAAEYENIYQSILTNK